MNVKVKNGAMAEITGAENFAYNGKIFHSFTADYSKCKKKKNKMIVLIIMEVLGQS